MSVFATDVVCERLIETTMLWLVLDALEGESVGLVL